MTLHPEKSKVVYCKDGKRTATYPQAHFTFLGFTFRPGKARGAENRMFTSFLPGVSAEALKRLRKVVRGWRIHRQTAATLAELAKQCNPAIRGWWNYFGAFYRTAMAKLARYIGQRLEQWARRKYKTLLRRKRRSVDWLRRMKNESPRLFYYGSVVGERVTASGKQGVPQGGVISPLLSNIYLTEVDRMLDRMLERAKETTRNGKYTYVEYARFADDRVPRAQRVEPGSMCATA